MSCVLVVVRAVWKVSVDALTNTTTHCAHACSAASYNYAAATAAKVFSLESYMTPAGPQQDHGLSILTRPFAGRQAVLFCAVGLRPPVPARPHPSAPSGQPGQPARRSSKTLLF
eukprot:COSAG01_NODE_30686_length_611_cov_1.111328_1_plen_113_part_10